MKGDFSISVTRFTPATLSQQRSGLMGFVTLVLDGRLRLDGITVRRDLTGAVSISFPERIDGAGKRHAFVWPLDDATRSAITNAVLQGLNVGKLGAA